MNRYFFNGDNENGDNADAFIDATNPAEAFALYGVWCEEVMGEPIVPKHVWILPNVSSEPIALHWYKQIIHLSEPEHK